MAVNHLKATGHWALLRNDGSASCVYRPLRYKYNKLHLQHYATDKRMTQSIVPTHVDFRL